MSEGEGLIKVIPAATGFLLVRFYFCIRQACFTCTLTLKKMRLKGLKRIGIDHLLVLAITLHNILEGLAVGVLFGGAALGMDGTHAGALLLQLV